MVSRGSIIHSSIRARCYSRIIENQKNEIQKKLLDSFFRGPMRPMKIIIGTQSALKL